MLPARPIPALMWKYYYQLPARLLHSVSLENGKADITQYESVQPHSC